MWKFEWWKPYTPIYGYDNGIRYRPLMIPHPKNDKAFDISCNEYFLSEKAF